MHPRVVAQLRVKRRREHVAFAHHDAAPVAFRQQLDRRTETLDPRRAYEDRRERWAAERPDMNSDLGRIVLTAEGVAPNRDVDKTERRLIEPGDLASGDDHPHARSPK